MIITINYEFEDIMCDVYYDVDRCHRKPCCVDYSYDVDVWLEDVYEYLVPFTLKEEYKKGYHDAIENLFDLHLIDLEALAEDEDFIEFLKDKYEEDAKTECQKEHN